MDNQQTMAALAASIQRAENQIYKNLNERLFSDDRPIRVPTLREKIKAFFFEAKNRIQNAYDCLVKGVDPYGY